MKAPAPAAFSGPSGPRTTQIATRVPLSWLSCREEQAEGTLGAGVLGWSVEQ